MYIYDCVCVKNVLMKIVFRILHESLLRPASNAAIGIVSSKTMPNLRSAINSSSKNGSIVLKNDECKSFLNGISVSVIIIW